jgi:hypothetical protein
MIRERLTFGVASLLAGLLAAPAAIAADEEVKAADIAAKMTTVVDDLGRKQTGAPVQGEQKAIVSDLDALIASLEKECEKCRGGIKSNNPRNGLQDSVIRRGTGDMGPLSNVGDGGKDWGKLSERERDRILQSMTEGFPPEYRTVLERYYRRLAEEKSAKAGAEKKTSEPAAAKP